MSELVGEARVRIRPDTRGFQSETQSALKGPLLSIGKLITGALAIKGGVDFAKEILSDAAQVQKSAEVIHDNFGKAGDAIIEFADNAGLKLGLTEHITESTAAKFGILFHNIGIGEKPAAQMTLNLEKLAGSLASVRGVKAETILNQLPQALSGNLRSLKQLGFVFDQTQLKDEAVRLGLISTRKQALDPGSKAIAVYSLLTRDLARYQDLAAKHANDAKNIQARLSAEWDHAKETLGTALLPEVQKYGLELADWINKGEKSGQIQKDINAIAHDGATVIKGLVGAVKLGNDAYGTFARLVGGKDNAIKILAGAFTLLYTQSKLIKWGIIEAGIQTTGEKAVVADKRVGGLALSLQKLKRLGPIAVVVALSFVPENKKGQDVLDKAHLGFLGKLPFIGTTEQQLAEAGNKVGEAFSKGVADVLGDRGKKKGMTPTEIIAKAGRDMKFDITTGLPFPKLKGDATKIGSTIAEGIAAGIKKKDIAHATAETALTALKSAAAVANNEAAQQLSDAKYQVAQARDTLAQAVKASKQAVADSINQAKQNLSSIAASIAGSAGKTGADTPLTGILAQRLKELQARVKTGVADTKTVQLAQELQNQIAFKANAPGAGGGLTQRLADLSDLGAKGAIGGAQFNKRLDQILKTAGVTAQVILRTQGVAAKDQFVAEVAAAKAQKAAIDAGPQAKGSGFAVAIVKPLEVLHDQQRIIAQDAHAVGTAQLGVQRAGLHVQQTAAAEQKKQTALLAKIAANQPSKHETAQLDALLRKQGVSKTAKDAETATRGRHGG